MEVFMKSMNRMSYDIIHRKLYKFDVTLELDGELKERYHS